MKKFTYWLLWLVFTLMAIPRVSMATSVPFLPPAERAHPLSQQPWPVNSFLTLAYHDVEDGGANQRYLAVRTSALIDQMNWLHDNGYQPVSVQQIIDAHEHKGTLPPKRCYSVSMMVTVVFIHGCGHCLKHGTGPHCGRQ